MTGLCSFSARLASLLATVVVDAELYTEWPAAVAGTVCIMCAVLVFFLPETDARGGLRYDGFFFLKHDFFKIKNEVYFFTERKRGERKSDGRLWTTCIDDCIIFAL